MIPIPVDPLRRRQRAVFVSLAAALVLLSAVSSCGPHRPGAGGFQMPPVPVEVSDVKPQIVRDQFRALGTIESDQDVVIVSELDGTLRSLPFTEGQPVQQGSLLAQIDDRELRAEAERAEALHQLAAANYDRSKKLAQEQAISGRELDDARSAFRVAEATATLASVRLEKAHIRAPFDGVVGRRLSSVGSWVRAGDPIAHVAKLSTLRVAFSAPERFLAELHPGRTVEVRTPAWPGRVFEGRLSVVDPNVEAATRTVHLLARVPNPGGLLRPGLSADVAVTLAERPGSLTIPEEAVFAEGSSNLVFIVKPDSTVTRVPVQLGSRDSARVEVLRGLSPGQVVVRTGHQKLFEGAHVMPVSDVTALAGPGAPEGASATAAHDSATAATAPGNPSAKSPGKANTKAPAKSGGKGANTTER